MDNLCEDLKILRFLNSGARESLKAIAGLFEGLRSTLIGLGVPIDSFQGFSEEIADLPGKYSEEAGGCILIGLTAAPSPQSLAMECTSPASLEVTDLDSGVSYFGSPVACIALRSLPSAGEGTAEVKRLYVHPSARGRAFGKAMSMRLIEIARQKGYKRLVLDSLYRLPAAVRLYRELGFVDTHPYCHNPMPDAVYLAMSLEGPTTEVATAQLRLPDHED